MSSNLTKTGFYGNKARFFRRWKAFLVASLLASFTATSPVWAFTPDELLSVRQVATYGDKEGKGRLRQPSAVTVASDGKVYILDGTVNRVAVFSPDGTFLYDFGTSHLNMPLGMAMDGKGRLYVTDTQKGRIQVFSSDGGHLRTITLPSPPKGEQTEPVDVAIDDDNRLLYVVDNSNHRLLLLDLRKNKVIKSLGRMGMDDGEFRWPFSIALGKQGIAYIVDVVNTTVRTVHPDENWAFGFDIGSWGIQKGEFYRPKGIAIDIDGNVLVSDSYLGVIQRFSAKGRFQAVLSDDNGKIHRFTTPARLFVDRNNRLYVVEMFANRITVFEFAR